MAATQLESRPSRVNLANLAVSWREFSEEMPQVMIFSEYRPRFMHYNPVATHPRLVGWQNVFGIDFKATTPQGWVLLELGIPEESLKRYAAVHDHRGLTPDRVDAMTQRHLDVFMASKLGIPVAQAVLARVVGNADRGLNRASDFAEALTHPQGLRLLGPSAVRLMTLGRIIDAMRPNHWHSLIRRAERRELELTRHFPDPSNFYYQGKFPNGGDRNLAHEALATAAQYSYANALAAKPYKFDSRDKHPILVTMATVVAVDEIASKFAGIRGRETIGLSLFESPDGESLTKTKLRTLRTVSVQALASEYKDWF